MAPKKSKGSTISLLDLQRQNNHRTFQDTLPQFSTAKDENPDGEEGADRSDGVWRPPRQVDDSNDRRGGRFGASGGEDRRGGTDESVVDEDMHWRRGPGIMPTSEHFVKAQAAAVAAQAADEKKAYRKRKQELDELRRQEEEESRKHHKALLEQAALAADTIEECRLVIIEDALANIASGANQTATAADDFISLLEASELTSALPSIVALKVAYVELYKNASTREGVDAVVDRMQPVLSAMFINSGLRQHKLLFLTAMPRFAKELQMPRLSAGWGLVEAFWDSLYMKGVIEEQYFTMWYEDTDDETKGRADLLVELTNWMQWITSGSSAALDLEDDNQDSEVSEEEEIDAHLQSRRTKFR